MFGLTVYGVDACSVLADLTGCIVVAAGFVTPLTLSKGRFVENMQDELRNTAGLRFNRDGFHNSTHSGLWWRRRRWFQ